MGNQQTNNQSSSIISTAIFYMAIALLLLYGFAYLLDVYVMPTASHEKSNRIVIIHNSALDVLEKASVKTNAKIW